MNRWKCEFNL